MNSRKYLSNMFRMRPRKSAVIRFAVPPDHLSDLEMDIDWLQYGAKTYKAKICQLDFRSARNIYHFAVKA